MRSGLKFASLSAAVIALVCGAIGFEKNSDAQAQLSITYGPAGLQQLSYGGNVLEDLSKFPNDNFHIWHMKMTDLQGRQLSDGQFGWGENNNGRSWDAASKTWTYRFSWGSISVQYVQNGNNLDVQVTETNNTGSGVILDGAELFPLALHFPQLPAGFFDASYPQLSFNTTAPSVTLASYGSGEVAAVVQTATVPLYSGFFPTGQNNSYTALISSTSPDGLASFQPHNDRPVLPGNADTFSVSLRFAPPSTPAVTLGRDAYANWAKTWPSELNWTDRRAIGTVYLASSPSGDSSRAGGFPNNPRRYFNDGNSSDFDVTTAAGLKAFQSRILQQARDIVSNLRRLNAQGVITWDIEGEEYPQNTSYVCSPDGIAQISPEMESVVSDSSSPYAGMKLDDAYFKTIVSGGFRAGVCVRPQHFTKSPNGTAQQTYLANSDVATELIRKIKFAHDRWGVTLFYVDSSVESNGAVLDASIFQQVARAFPDSLLIPEESTYKHYAYTAPFQTFIFHGDTGTNAAVYAAYPHAFSANLINDVSAANLLQSKDVLTASVKAGDILMAHADNWQANDPTIVSIYDAAGVSAPPPVTSPAPTPDPVPTPSPAPQPPPTPAPVTSDAAVSVTSPRDGDSLSGSVVVQGTIRLNLDAAGSYLMVDGVEVGTARVSQQPFVYALDTTALSNGTHKLQLWAHDTGNSTSLSAPVSISVNNQGAGSSSPSVPVLPTPPPSTPTVGAETYPIMLSYPVAGQTISGVLVATGAIPQTLDAAGSFLMLDGVEVGSQRLGSAPFAYGLDTSLISPGQHVLQLWAHDIGNNTLLSNPVTITVRHQ